MVPRARGHALLRLQFSGTRDRMMRKTRDYDAELKALGDKARALKVKKVQQLGELVTSTGADALDLRSEEHTSELQSLMRISYAVFCLKKKTHNTKHHSYTHNTTSKSKKEVTTHNKRQN